MGTQAYLIIWGTCLLCWSQVTTAFPVDLSPDKLDIPFLSSGQFKCVYNLKTTNLLYAHIAWLRKPAGAANPLFTYWSIYFTSAKENGWRKNYKREIPYHHRQLDPAVKELKKAYATKVGKYDEPPYTSQNLYGYRVSSPDSVYASQILTFTRAEEFHNGDYHCFVTAFYTDGRMEHGISKTANFHTKIKMYIPTFKDAPFNHVATENKAKKVALWCASYFPQRNKQWVMKDTTSGKYVPLTTNGELPLQYQRMGYSLFVHSGTGEYVLEIPRTMDKAGAYGCGVKGDRGLEFKYSELIIVQGSDFSCNHFPLLTSPVEPGQSIRIKCQFMYRGNIPPLLEFRLKKNSNPGVILGEKDFNRYHDESTATKKSVNVILDAINDFNGAILQARIHFKVPWRTNYSARPFSYQGTYNFPRFQISSQGDSGFGGDTGRLRSDDSGGQGQTGPGSSSVVTIVGAVMGTLVVVVGIGLTIFAIRKSRAGKDEEPIADE